MERGTFIFEDWLTSIDQRVRESGTLDETLEIVAFEAERCFGTRIWFARVMGPRWSYIAGIKSEKPTGNELRKTDLDSGIGMIVENRGVLSYRQMDRLKIFIDKLVLDNPSTR